MSQGWRRMIVVLAGLLLLAYATIVFGKARPTDAISPTNFGEAGTSAFLELLRRSGYSVRIVEASSLTLAKDEMAIIVDDSPVKLGSPAYDDEEDGSSSDDGNYGDSTNAAGEPSVEEDNASQRDGPPHPIEAKLSRLNGPALMLYPAADRTQTGTIRVLLPENARSAMTVEIATAAVRAKMPTGAAHTTVLYATATDAANAAKFQMEDREERELGYSLANPPRTVVRHAEFLLNGAIGQAQNASLALAAVQATSDRKKVVYWTGASDVESVLDLLGPAALSIRNGVLVLFAALFVAFGSRFGLASRKRRRQHGSRDAAEALAALIGRWRRSDPTIEAALERTRRRLVKERVISTGDAEAEWQRKIPPPILIAYAEVEAMKGERLPDDLVLSTIAQLDRRIEHQYGSKRGAESEQGRSAKRRRVYRP